MHTHCHISKNIYIYIRMLNYIHTFSFYPITYFILLYIKYPKTYPNIFRCMHVCRYVQSTHIHTPFHIQIFNYSIFICIHTFDNYTYLWQNYGSIFDMILSNRFECSLVLVELLISSVMEWIFVDINVLFVIKSSCSLPWNACAETF